MFDLSGRVALVTGAGQGVGAGIAHALADRGAQVAVNDIDFQQAMAVANEIDPTGMWARPIAFDVTDHADVLAAVEVIGPIDILVNNAGSSDNASWASRACRDSDPQEWRGPIEVNLHGVMLCSRAVINSMCERGFGRIITITSDTARTGASSGVSSYAAGQGAAIAFMRHLAAETARDGVTANTISLGAMASADPELHAAALRNIPVGRPGSAQDVGYLAVYLASDEAAWMTGQLISLNGGQNAF